LGIENRRARSRQGRSGSGVTTAHGWSRLSRAPIKLPAANSQRHLGR
jgi:hypothetical protein